MAGPVIFCKKAPDDVLGLGLDGPVFFEHLRLGRREQAIEPPQHRQRQNDLAILVPLVRSAEQVADAPDEVGELGMGFRAHGFSTKETEFLRILRDSAAS